MVPVIQRPLPRALLPWRFASTITLANSNRACAPVSSPHTRRTPRELAHIHGRELAGRVAIETTTKEDTEMARTSKTDKTTENVIPLRPEAEEPRVDDQVEESPEHALEEPPETPDEAPEQQLRSRGPALNRVELIGRVAKEADVRVTPSGMHVAYLRVATNGLRDRDTEFHQLTAFGKTAEFAGEHLGKGRLVYVEGRLQTRDYRDRDGIRRWVTTIIVNRLQVLDQRRPADQAEE